MGSWQHCSGLALRRRHHEALGCLGHLQLPHLWLAAAYAQLGQIEEARAEAARVLRINLGFTIERHKRVWAHKDSTDLEHRLDGLRKAGLPES